MYLSKRIQCIIKINRRVYNCRPAQSTLDKTTQYVYNGIGNLESVTTRKGSGTPTTTTFGYTDTAHPDRLTSFGGKAITYNANGGVASYDGWNYTWNKGKLSSIRKNLGSSSRAVITPILGPSKTYSFSYNGLGQRVRQSYSHFWLEGDIISVHQGEVTAYTKNYTYDHSGRLICEDISKTLYLEGTESSKIVYLYDESGIVGMQYTIGTTTNTYYFLRNLQGDVIAIYDTNGAEIASYSYDAWGNCTINSTTTNYSVAHANPIRYRGYYYDEDTKLYYLNSRYYSPEFRRFISPDDTAYLDPESVNGLNLYCYCGNDPVNYCDPSGHEAKWWAWLLSGIAVIAGIALSATGVGGILGSILIGAGAGSLINGYVNEANGGSFLAGYIGGAISGALCGVGAGFGGIAFVAATKSVGSLCLGYLSLGAVASFAGGFLGNFTGTLYTDWHNSGFNDVNLNINELLTTSTIMGTLNIFAGLGSGASSIVGEMGKTMGIGVNSQWAHRLLAGTVAGGTEAFYDTTSYLLSFWN